jgi:hypothetical protein
LAVAVSPVSDSASMDRIVSCFVNIAVAVVVVVVGQFKREEQSVSRLFFLFFQEGIGRKRCVSVVRLAEKKKCR